MAITVRKNMGALSFGTATALNAFIRAYVPAETTFPHYDISSTPGGDYTAPTSTPLSVANTGTADLPAVIVMAEAARTVLMEHFLDDIAHGAADSTNHDLIKVATIPLLDSGSSQGDTDTLLNALATAYEAHRVDTTVHPTADATNVISASSATNLSTSKLLAADVRVQTNAHVLFAWPSPSLNIVAD